MLIELTYNPYLVETAIKVKGNPLKSDHDLIRFCENKRLQGLIDSLLTKISEQFRVRQIELTVNCTDLDSEDVEDAVKRFNSGGKDTSIKLTVKKHSQSIDKKIQRLKMLYKKSQDGPFEEFRSDKLKNNFNSALSPDFEVNVIATMSSGKSTVINAILGQDLMPSKNEACTATIARIQDSDKYDHFVGKRLNKEGKLIDKSQAVSKDILNKWNEDESTSLIELKGNIKTVKQTDSTRLVFIDTPGPNNSRDASHRKTMLQAINSKPLSMVLYILNATQLNIDDDAALLKIVADEMKAGGRKAQDRFIFVLNKIDHFDPEDGESIASAIENAKKSLKRNGIDNPLVIPVSAELAKLIRMARYQGESKLTRKQRNDLKSFIELFVEEDEMNMLNHVKKDINPLCYDHLSTKLNDANDNNEKAEILSGIPIVEELFNEFLEKHALPAKIKDAVDSFRHVMAKAKRIEGLNKQLKKGKDELKKSVEALEAFEKNKVHVNKAKEFKESVGSKIYTPSKELVVAYEKIQTKVHMLIEDITEDFQGLVEPSTAVRKINKAEKKCSEFIDEIETTIQKSVDDDFLAGLSLIRKDYEKYVVNLLEKEFPLTGDADLLEFQKETMRMPEVDQLAKNHTQEFLIDTEIVSDSVFYNPFSWGRTKTKKVYDDRVNMKDIWVGKNGRSQVLLDAVRKNKLKSESIAKINSDNGKKIIIKSMKSIEHIFNENIKNMNEALNSKNKSREMIANNNFMINWYKSFDNELNDILSVKTVSLASNNKEGTHVVRETELVIS